MNKVLTFFLPQVVHTVKHRKRVPLRRLSATIRRTIRYGEWHECLSLLDKMTEQYGMFTAGYTKRAYTAFWYLHRRLITTFKTYGQYKLYYGDALDNPECYNNDTFNPDAIRNWTSRPYSDAPVLQSEYYYQKWLESENARQLATIIGTTEGMVSVHDIADEYCNTDNQVDNLDVIHQYPGQLTSDQFYAYERKRMVRNWQGLLKAMLSYGIPWVNDLYVATVDEEQYRPIQEVRDSIDYGVLEPVISTVIEEIYEQPWEEVAEDWQYDV